MKDIMYKVSLESNEFLQGKLQEIVVLKGKIKKNLLSEEDSNSQQRDLLNEIAGKFGN